jgi:hypothetical protein
MTIKINSEQKLYVIPLTGGDGYTTLGFEYADRRARDVAAWITAAEAETVSLTATPGTAEHYEQYVAIMAAGARHARHTGTRCEADLIPALRGLEGQRVEVRTPDGETSRFYVGKSSGWMPCHLEIKRRDSSGGGAVYLPEGATVRVVGKARR